MPLYSIGERRVTLVGKDHFVAPDATLVGDITLESAVSIWFQVVIRAENDRVVIGEGSNVQDGSVLHVDPGFPLTLARNVSIGHKVMLHGCSVGDNSLIGMGAIVLNGARIGNNSLVGAGALVTEGKSFPDNSLIVGSPARAVRSLDEKAVAQIRHGAEHYVRRSREYAKGLKRVG
jgi:carbonic anhydrase/acetyltransferase-like protein (isoleucine patch superfamily)